MMMALASPPSLLAFDFDGVICDGLREYFQTAWRAYREIWPQNASETPPDGLAEQFYRLRPIVETGWEMPLVLRALQTGYTEQHLFQEWRSIASTVLQTDSLSDKILGAVVDRLRDQWLQQDLSSWLALHQFYPGLVDRLKHWLANAAEAPSLQIITTKEGRFVQQLLAMADLTIPADWIWGKERRQPKADRLRDLLQQKPRPTIWFLEDRLQTLLNIAQQPDLQEVGLFLATWGYNTAPDRQLAAQHPRIHTLTLDRFRQPFEYWHS